MEKPDVARAKEPRLHANELLKVYITSAERSREWRACRANEKRVLESNSSTSALTAPTVSQPVRKNFNSSTERTRKWRARRKDKIKTLESQSSVSTSDTSSTSFYYYSIGDEIYAQATSPPALKKAKTSAERSREWRARCANKKKPSTSASISSSTADDTSTSSTSQFIIKNPTRQSKEERVPDDDEVSQLKVFALPYDEYSNHAEDYEEYEEQLVPNDFDGVTDDCDPLGFDDDVAEPSSNYELMSVDQPCLIKSELDVSDDMITDIIIPNNGELILSRNFQSIREHHPDLMYTVTQDRTFFLFSETFPPNGNLPNFECCVQLKGDDQQATGVGVFHKAAYGHVVTSHMEVISHQSIGMSMRTQPIGEISTVNIQLSDGNKIVFMAVYISPETSVQDVIEFLHPTLAPYSKKVSMKLQGDSHLLPMVISGYFNIDFSTPNAQPLIDFMREKFHLEMDSEEKIWTRQDGTIDAVFQRYLDNLQSPVYISHFDYNRN